MKRLFTLSLAGLLGLTFTACKKQDEAVSSSPRPIDIVNAGSPTAHTFETVARHLDFGGEALGYLNVDGALTELGGTIDELINVLKDMGLAGAELSPTLSQDIINATGFDQVKAVGFSSVAEGTGYRNKFFVALEGAPRGFLKVYADEPQRFSVLNHVPERTLLLLQGKLNIETLTETIREIGHLIDRDSFQAGYEAFLDEEVGEALEIPLTMREVMALKEIEMSIVVAEAESFLSAPFAAMRSYEFSLRFSGLGEFLERMVTPEMMGMSPVQVEGFAGYQLPSDFPLAANIVPVIGKDTSTGELVVASNLEFIGKLAAVEGIQSEDVRTVLNGMPDRGSWFFYQNRKINELLQTAGQMGMAFAPSNDVPPAMTVLMQRHLMPFIYPTNSSVGYTLFMTEDGLAINTLTPYSPVRLSASAAVVPVGLLSAMAIPAFNKVREQSSHAVIENNLRQVYAGGMQAILETGKAEVTYQEIIDLGYFPAFRSAAGESYDHIIIRRDGAQTISVVTAAGEVIDFSF